MVLTVVVQLLAMKTSTLLLVFASVILILLSFPEESQGIIFVLTDGKIRDLQRKGHDQKLRRRGEKKRRSRNRKRKQQKQLERKKRKELKRWLARFEKKVSSEPGV